MEIKIDKHNREYYIENGKVEKVYSNTRSEFYAPYTYDKKYHCWNRRYLSYKYLKELERTEKVMYENI